jgi:hypothetical protein
MDMDDDGGATDADAKLHVDAAALAVMFYNIVGMSTGLGILTALDTLCAAAHGANQPSKMGRYLHTGMVVMAMLSCLVGAVLCNTTRVLLLLRQPPEVAHQADIRLVDAAGPALPLRLRAAAETFAGQERDRTHDSVRRRMRARECRLGILHGELHPIGVARGGVGQDVG